MKNGKNDRKKISIEAFRKMTIAHPLLNTAIEELLSLISDAEKGELIVFFGPTGVGKTALSTRIKDKLLKDYRIENGHNPSVVPVVLSEAPHPDTQKFSWIEYYRRALVTLNEPLIDKKHGDIKCSAYEEEHLKDDQTGHTLRMTFENALKYRKTRVLIIDEAQHIAKGSSGASIIGLLNYMKSLANLTDTVIVLIGTYELLAFVDLNGQLCRREMEVHFPRYKYDNPKDLQIFFNVVESFFKKLPIAHNLDLAALNDKFYFGSAGCVGILSTWIRRSLKLAVRNNDSVLTIDHIDKKTLSLQKLMKITEELVEGEALLIPDKKAEETIRVRLGLLSPLATSSNLSEPKSISQSKSKTRVGKRKPGRDKVGVNPELSP
jgi:archaellum biogenesis ATPase FlaH